MCWNMFWREVKSESVVPRTKVRWQHRVRSLSQDSTMWSWHATGWVSVKWVTFCLGLHVRRSSRQAFGLVLFNHLFGFWALAGIFFVVATTPTCSYHFIWSKYLVQRSGHSSHSSWEVCGTRISFLPFLMISSLSWTKWPPSVLRTQPNMIFFIWWSVSLRGFGV